MRMVPWGKLRSHLFGWFTIIRFYHMITDSEGESHIVKAMNEITSF